jgi:peptidyl-prolyl cis-trans isomerase SurA
VAVATLALAAMLLHAPGWAQVAAASSQLQGVVLDRVVAVVNGDLILESDVDEERRLEAFQPFRAPTETTRDKIIERLVDRTLILQQALLQPEPPITDAAVDAQLATLRKEIQACKEYACATDDGWEKFVATQGFTMEELRRQWQQRMEVLRFIEERFRLGVRVQDDEVKTYYEKTLLPEYARRHATAPPLETIAPRIEEILVQQRVTGLLTDWLKSLRAQGQVRILPAGEVAP